MANQSYRIHIRQGEFELDVEGDMAFVESYVEAFLSDEADFDVPVQKSRREKSAKMKAHPAKPRGSAKTKGGGSGAGEAEVDKAALNAFMRGRKPSSNKDRYLQYMRFWLAQGVKEVGDAQIQACFAAEGLVVPPTGRQNFGSLRAEGKVKSGSKRGLWALTPAGAEEQESKAAKKVSAPGRKAKRSAKGNVRAAKGRGKKGAAKRPARKGVRGTPKSESLPPKDGSSAPEQA